MNKMWSLSVSELYLTFYDSPWCLPPQNPFAIHLIFFVTAHHGKGHGLLRKQMFRYKDISVQKKAAQGLWDDIRHKRGLERLKCGKVARKEALTLILSLSLLSSMSSSNSF